jgi:hypothetical protein
MYLLMPMQNLTKINRLRFFINKYILPKHYSSFTFNWSNGFPLGVVTFCLAPRPKIIQNIRSFYELKKPTQKIEQVFDYSPS